MTSPRKITPGTNTRQLMTHFRMAPQRFDPYANFKFRVKFEGRYVAGITQVGALHGNPHVGTPRVEHDPRVVHQAPARRAFEAITLERGVTHDAGFLQWVNTVHGLGAGADLTDFRKDIVIELFDEAGHLVKAYTVFRCWASAFQALPDLDASAHAMAIEHITLKNEGWKVGTDRPG